MIIATVLTTYREVVLWLAGFLVGWSFRGLQ